jgi:hypothetical protein
MQLRLSAMVAQTARLAGGHYELTTAVHSCGYFVHDNLCFLQQQRFVLQETAEHQTDGHPIICYGAKIREIPQRKNHTVTSNYCRQPKSNRCSAQTSTLIPAQVLSLPLKCRHQWCCAQICQHINPFGTANETHHKRNTNKPASSCVSQTKTSC